MPSNIDPLKPEEGYATTASVRANFSAAKSEIEALQTDKADALTLSAHTTNTTNPHGVTAAQVGAIDQGALDIVAGNLSNHLLDTFNPHGVTAAQVGAVDQGALDIVAGNLSNHLLDTFNPHAVTAAQVGAADAQILADLENLVNGHLTGTTDDHNLAGKADAANGYLTDPTFGGTSIAFFDAIPAAQPTITGSRTDGTALASLLLELSTMGLIVDMTDP